MYWYWFEYKVTRKSNDWYDEIKGEGGCRAKDEEDLKISAYLQLSNEYYFPDRTAFTLDWLKVITKEKYNEN